jgi:hypothetical protein
LGSQRRDNSASAKGRPNLVETQVDVPEPPGRARVRDIKVAGREGQADLDILLTGEVRVTEGLVTKSYAELIVEGPSLGAQLERAKQDMTRLGSPLRNLTIVRDPRDAQKFYVRVSLIAPATPSVRRSPGLIRWHFQGQDLE